MGPYHRARDEGSPAVTLVAAVSGEQTPTFFTEGLATPDTEVLSQPLPAVWSLLARQVPQAPTALTLTAHIHTPTPPPPSPSPDLARITTAPPFPAPPATATADTLDTADLFLLLQAVLCLQVVPWFPDTPPTPRGLMDTLTTDTPDAGIMPELLCLAPDLMGLHAKIEITNSRH